MKILFINLERSLFEDLPHPKHGLAPLDLGSAMQAATQAGHQVEFIETGTGQIKLHTLLQRVERDPAEMVVLKPDFESIQFASTLAAAARPSERHVLWFGPPASHSHQWLLNRVPQSYVAVDETDRIVAEMAEHARLGKDITRVPGIAYWRDGAVVRSQVRPLEQNLDTLPMPRHDLLINGGYNFHYPLKPKGRLKMGYLLSSRGCPYSCTFCSEVERASFGKRYRMHSPERMAYEFSELSQLGATGVYFEDDLFAIDKARFLEMTRAIETSRGDISWCAQVRAGDIDDEIAEALARSGCASVACGIESGSDRVLDLLRKATSVEAMQRGARALKRAGVGLVAYVIIGVPGESAEEREATLRLAESLEASLVQVHVFVSYPGTQAMVEHPELGGAGASKFVPSPSRPDHEELLALQRRFYRRFYLKPGNLMRHTVARFPQIMANPGGELRNAWSLAKHAVGL